MTDYAKMKNDELSNLLKQRGLPHTGKKAEMVSRLQEADKTTDKPAPAKPAADEDEIDWDDDVETNVAKPTEATSQPAAAAMAAGGQGQVPNPQAVPNQKADIDPAKTDDLAVQPPASNDTSAPAAETNDGKATTVTEAKTEEKPPVDFTMGLAQSTADEELAKLKARAAKFGIDTESEQYKESLAKLERSKKFDNGGPKGLNEALPERRKRERDTHDEAGRGNSKRRGGRRDGGGRRGGPRSEAAPAKSNGSVGWMNYADRARAEARKARFEGKQ